MSPETTPLGGIRVLNVGIGWASRVASMLLAEQGAEVIEIVRPHRKRQLMDALLDRSKKLIEVDLKTEEGLQYAVTLGVKADIIFENMRPGAAGRLGLDYRSLAANNSGVIYVSLPGFAEGDVRRSIAAWEGSISAATGVFTDLSPVGRLIGGTPTYTSIPMASAYGGILGAATATLGFFGYLRTGKGERFEVPLADAVMSAMALLIAELEGAPVRYDFPPLERGLKELMIPVLQDLRDYLTEDHITQIKDYLRTNASPGFNTYECGDGKLLFVCASDHVSHVRGFLQTVGVLDKAISEGMASESPFDEQGAGNNFNIASTLTPRWRKRLIQLISESLKTRSAKEWEHLLRAANVPATQVQTTMEWLQDENLEHGGVTIDLPDERYGTVRQPGRHITINGTNAVSPEVVSCVLPNEKVDWSDSIQQERPTIETSTGGPILDGIRVLDFSNIIAGPAAGRTLAEFGADVIRVDAPSPQAGPFATMWFGIDVNQGKRAVILDLKTDEGKAVLAKLVKSADVVLHNFLDASAARIGIAHEQLAEIKPDIISCQISAWGGAKGGGYKDDPSFDPVLQAASGIMTRYGTPKSPVLHGIASCVDYMTGFLAVTGISQALVARARGQGGSYVRTSLAMGAQLVQFPFMVSAEGVQTGEEVSGQAALGSGPTQSLYQLKDGWVYLGARSSSKDDLAETVGASATTVSGIADAIKDLTKAELETRISKVAGSSIAYTQSLKSIRLDRTRDKNSRDSNWLNSGSHRLSRAEHPSGYWATICEPTWVRPERTQVLNLAPAPWPGEHTRSVLIEHGFSDEQADQLLQIGAVSSNWSVLKHYLPL